MKLAWRFFKLAAVILIVLTTAWFVTRNRTETSIDFWPITNPMVKPVYSIFGLGMLLGIGVTILASGYTMLTLIAANQKLKREIKKIQTEAPQIVVKPEPSADVRLSPDL